MNRLISVLVDCDDWLEQACPDGVHPQEEGREGQVQAAPGPGTSTLGLRLLINLQSLLKQLVRCWVRDMPRYVFAVKCKGLSLSLPAEALCFKCFSHLAYFFLGCGSDTINTDPDLIQHLCLDPIRNTDPDRAIPVKSELSEIMVNSVTCYYLFLRPGAFLLHFIIQPLSRVFCELRKGLNLNPTVVDRQLIDKLFNSNGSYSIQRTYLLSSEVLV